KKRSQEKRSETRDARFSTLVHVLSWLSMQPECPQRPAVHESLRLCCAASTMGLAAARSHLAVAAKRQAPNRKGYEATGVVGPVNETFRAVLLTCEGDIILTITLICAVEDDAMARAEELL